MSKDDPKEIWASILETLEDTLQLGFLEEARYVTEVSRDGNTLVLSVQSEGAFRFFSDSQNQNRVLILARRVGESGAGIEAVRAERID